MRWGRAYKRDEDYRGRGGREEGAGLGVVL